MSKNLTRREALKTLGLTIGGAAIGVQGFSQVSDNKVEYSLGLDEVFKPIDNPLGRPITAITCGAGNRGNVYGGYAANFPGQIRIIGVAEPIPIRNERYTKIHHIPEENRFKTWEDVFKRPKFADAVIITMPDNLHYVPCMTALEMGYDVLLEKPMAQTEQECRDILAKVKNTGRIVAICHVLRYTPYFIKMKQLIADGAIGELISFQHMEPIYHIHMSHSYVRGNWHNSKETTPIILAKSCHDLDILRWMIGKPCKDIVAMGDLKWFRKENAPAGSTSRCMDGCAAEAGCPYSALKVYGGSRDWTYVFDLPDDKDKQQAAVIEYLRTTNYGRCVYDMDNDQPDHYITSMRFDGNITANFSMEAFTSYGGRRTRVMGAMGDMVGDMEELNLTDFRTGKSVKLVPRAEDLDQLKNSGHGGGDWSLMRDFILSVSNQDPKYLTSTIDQSIESHVMGFAAEKSRATQQIIQVRM
ncbi:MAG: Gfo/Idh/MocA family oxidoreductase [Bacteroidetes bacterium]|nr:Gfo/Idh/MocA family oxidoreductase [Bacteroidota bacterium]